MIRNKLLLFGVLLPLSLFAAPSAKVILKKGKVTKLLPHKKQALPVKMGDILPQDTSVVTSEKSVLKLKFDDDSTLTLGPKSMIVIQRMPKNEAKMLNLLSGAINSQVKKHKLKGDDSAKTKMMITTEFAVLGVRGTNFKVIHNPEAKKTSLVTLEGEVAMAKKEAVIKPVTDTTPNSVVPSFRVATPVEESQIYAKKFSNKSETVAVKEGRYSGLTRKAKAPTRPIKIAPKQYDILAKNEGLNKTALEVMDVKKDKILSDQGLVATKAPPAGGVVDLDSGLYIPPSKKTKLDQQTGTYEIDKKLGSIDDKTGDYRPAKGLAVNKSKGLVVVDEQAIMANDQDIEQVKEALAEANKEVKKQVSSQDDLKTDTSSWWPDRHRIAVSFVPISEAIDVKDKETGESSSFVSKEFYQLIFSWEQYWSDQFQTAISFGQQEYELAEDNFSVEDYTDDSSHYFSLGFDYHFSDRWALSFDLVESTIYYVYGAGVRNNNHRFVALSDQSAFHLLLGVNYQLGTQLWGLDLALLAEIDYFPRQKVHVQENDEAFDGQGLVLGMSFERSLTDQLGLRLMPKLSTYEFITESYIYDRLLFSLNTQLFWRF